VVAPPACAQLRSAATTLSTAAAAAAG
jgi:hypothetical protein